MSELYKYPRTHHIEGSGVQRGDEDLPVVAFRALAGRHLVIEEKMDGSNCGVSFTPDGQLQLQSRGHFLTGGGRERHFALLKTWAHTHQAELWRLLQDRYLMFGEWLYAKHTIFYTDLPHYFLEFDLYDRQTELFLSTRRRRELLAGAPFVAPVRVLHEGPVESLAALTRWVGPSAFISGDHQERLRRRCGEIGLDPDRTLRETDPSPLMEGLYIKDEAEGIVQARYKFVRASFLQAVFRSESHWADRPLLPNELKAGVQLF